MTLRRLGLPVALIAFSTLWRIPSLDDPPWLNDEGVYATVGKAIFNGEALYRQVWENKPPAIYLLYGAVNAIAGSAHLLVGVRFLALVAALIAQTSVYRLARDWTGMATALLATAIAGVMLDLPLLDGTSANAEIFLIAATSLGMLLLWQGVAAVRRSDPRGNTWSRGHATLALAGVAFGIAILFKLVAGADLLAALALVAVTVTAGRLQAVAALLTGVTVPIGAIVLWLISRGLLGVAVYATIGYNQGYVSAGQSMHGPLVSIALLAIPALLVIAGVRVLRQERTSDTGARASVAGGGERRSSDFRRAGPASPPRLSLAVSALAAAPADHGLIRPAGPSWSVPAPRVESRPTALTGRVFTAASLWWLGLALFGALASGRSYLHYYLQAVPPFAICAALLLQWLDAARGRWIRHALVGLLAIWLVGIPLVSWQAVSATKASDPPGSRQYGYYGYAWQEMTGNLSDTAFGNRWDPRVERNVAVANYLRTHRAAPNRVYVWGNAPWIYFLSGYEHATRYLSAYYWPPIPSGMAEVLVSLRYLPPAYIVVIEPPLPASPALEAFVHARYRRVWRYQNAVVYRLR